MSDSRLQEIMTKSVVGRAERRVTWGHTVPAEGVTGVLGVHVTNSTVAVKDEDGRPMVDLIVDCDLWCSSSKNTKVLRCTCRNTELIDVSTVGKVLGDRDLKVSMLGARAVGVNVAEGKVTLQLEADVSVEMSALARIWVRAYDLREEILEDLDGGSDSDSRSGSDSGLSYSRSYTGSSTGYGSRSGSGSDSGSSDR